MKIALVIGHSQSSKGAANRASDIQEFDYNEHLASLIRTISKVDIKVVYRDTYKYLPDKINLLNPDYVVSLHCNAYNEKASGTECLYYHNSKKGKKLATLLQKAMLQALSLKDRGIKPKTSEDRGGYLLRYTTAPCVILEPFFIDNNKDYTVGLNLVDELAYNINDVLEQLE